jgi:hypothetical protein
MRYLLVLMGRVDRIEVATGDKASAFLSADKRSTAYRCGSTYAGGGGGKVDKHAQRSGAATGPRGGAQRSP